VKNKNNVLQEIKEIENLDIFEFEDSEVPKFLKKDYFEEH
jgi:hypothetical protein